MGKRMSETNRRLVLAVFREAKKALWDGKENPLRSSYRCRLAICYAIDDTDLSHYARKMAARVISTRLGGHSTVYFWLNRKVGIPYELLTSENIQEYRHRWLDALIEEFSN